MKCVCDFHMLEPEPIGNRFSNLSFWYINGATPDEQTWFEWAEEKPEGWLKKNYPWLEEMQIFVASGGSYVGYPRKQTDDAPCEFNRDMFKNPADRSVLDDYDFKPLVRACRNILRQGVRPCLKLHAVPIKYSKNPKISWFRINCRPPDDYHIYADYISALVKAMVDAFGKEEVCKWRWFIGAEMENPMWWEAPDGSAESAKNEYFKFHDWSVFALERVLGVKCGPIGAHAMMSGEYTGGLWDPAEFMNHCATGTNSVTGKIGSRLDFFALSYYDRAPGNIDSDEWQTNLPGKGGDLALFNVFVERTRKALDDSGFNALQIEVSEGGMLFGMDGKWLWHGLAPGGMYDATWTTWVFWKLLENKVQSWSRWQQLRTEGLFNGLEAASTHAMRLIAELQNDHRAAVTQPKDDRLIRVIAAADEDRKVHVLIFHHAVDITKTTDAAQMEIMLENLPFDGPVSITKNTLDKIHGDFWPQWEKDRTSLGVSDSDYFRSRDQLDVAHALINPLHRNLWAHYEKLYEPLAAFPAGNTKKGNVEKGRLTLSCTVECLSITLFTLSKIT